LRTYVDYKIAKACGIAEIIHKIILGGFLVEVGDRHV